MRWMQVNLVDTGGLTGWAAMDDTMKKRDEQTAKDHMSDIDTLLVFVRRFQTLYYFLSDQPLQAGLYSAVLTAFLIESYKDLQEDPQQVVIGLLRQISSQTNNYTITPTHVNSSTPFSDPSASSFTPQATDIRVNVCWFASLVFSLATASFGILVKQWLREYLAIDHAMAPHERARIRYFRTIGLNDWKLFEIAAILPLVLQLALALFFVGLCFFTWSVHHSIGTTSVCLVTGWAAFFILALLAPILSPRCPYKTSFLKTALSGTRIYALSVTRYAVEHTAYNRTEESLSKLWTHAVHISRASWSTMKMIDARIVRAAKWMASRLRAQRDVQEPEGRTDINNADDDSDDSRTHTPESSRFQVIKSKVYEGEENCISRNNEKDTTILLDVDTMLNDELLVAMEAALHQTIPPLNAVFQFALDVVGRRLNREDFHKHVFSWNEPLDLRTAMLSDTARNTVINIVAKGIISAWDQSDRSSLFYASQDPRILPACQFLVSDGGSVTHQVKSLIQKMLDSPLLPGRFLGISYESRRDSGHGRGLSSALSNIRDILVALEAEYIRRLVKVFFQCYFWEDGPVDTDDRIPCSLLAERLHWDDVRSVYVSCCSLIALMELALTAIWAANDQRRATCQSLTLPSGEVELLETVLDIIPVILEKRPDHKFSNSSLAGAPAPANIVFRWLFNIPEALPRFLDSILARSDILSTGAGGVPLLDSLYRRAWVYLLPMILNTDH